MTAGLSKQVRCLKYVCTLEIQGAGGLWNVLKQILWQVYRSLFFFHEEVLLCLQLVRAEEKRESGRYGGNSGRWRVVAAAVRMVAPWGQMAMAELPWRPGCWVLWIEESPVGKMKTTSIRLREVAWQHGHSTMTQRNTLTDFPQLYVFTAKYQYCPQKRIST
jgi:hypothetical protein